VIVMEHLRGPTLARALPSLDRAARIKLFRGICDGIAAAHEADVLHLDVKPENVIVENGAPIVTDFGLSTMVSDDARGRGGTAMYMAPEQRRGDPIDARADVYALGRLLAKMLDGREGSLHAIVARATDEDPSKRYANARALSIDLDRRLARNRRLARIGLGAIGAACLVLLVAFVVPPPAGGRAHIDESHWPSDSLPPQLWNVAFDPSGTRVKLTASHPGFACGQSLSELTDGATQYADWKHGFAFPPVPPGVCVNLDLIGTCGAPNPDARLCEFGEGAKHSTPIDARVASASTLDPARRADLGQWTEGVPCGERWIEVDLGRPMNIRAVRPWFYGAEHVPHKQRVAVDDGSGTWRDIYKTTDSALNANGFNASHYVSGPFTLDFPMATARRVRWTMDSCTTPDGKGHGWLFELEIFADVGRLEAWYRTIFLRE
jgi:hypothetical protein